MMKRILLFILQFAGFFGLLDLGGNWDAVNLYFEMRQFQQGNLHPTVLIPTLKHQVSSTHILIANGLVFAGILLAIILLVLALRKRLKPWGGITVAAFVGAIILALALKVGLPPAPTPDSLLLPISHELATLNS